MSSQTESTNTTRELSDPPTVLFVDDETLLLETYEARYGSTYTVVTASSGREALELVDNHIDIVFLDRRMPEMTGDEVCKRLRDQGFDQPIVMLSAVDPDGEEPAADYDAYITKPATETDVQATIATHLD